MNDLSETAGLRAYPLARRGMIMTSLISGFTLATQRVEAQAIQTDATGLEAGETQIPTTSGNLPAYFARPAKSGNFPVILVNEEIFGVHEYIKDVCRRLAKLGYFAVATEYYARQGDLSKMTDVRPDHEGRHSAGPRCAIYVRPRLDRCLGTEKWRQRHTDWRHGLLSRRQADLACAQRTARICGPPSCSTAHLGERRRLSSRRSRSILPTRSNARCWACTVARTRAYRSSRFGRPRQKQSAAHKIVEIVIYPDAPHGFHADYRPSYRQADAEDAWKRAIAWFHRFGVNPAG